MEFELHNRLLPYAGYDAIGQMGDVSFFVVAAYRDQSGESRTTTCVYIIVIGHFSILSTALQRHGSPHTETVYASS